MMKHIIGMKVTQSAFSRRNSCRGAALLVVLFAISVTAAILAMAIPVAQVAMLSSESHNDRILNYYVAESTISRMQIMMINDIIGYKDRATLSKSLSQEAADKYTEEAEKNNEERYTADGSKHTLTWQCPDFEASCDITIDDALCNYNLSGSESKITKNLQSYSRSFTITDSEDAVDNYKEMTAQILDYVDIDDLSRLNGMERSDYTMPEYNLPGLPRNGPIETVEELFLVPMVSQLMVTFDEQGIPNNLRVGLTPFLSKKFLWMESQKSSMTSSSPDYIRNMLGMGVRDNEELDRLTDAYDDFKNNGTALYESLEDADLRKLQSNFSTGESGMYTLTAVGSSDRHPSPRTIKVSFVISPRNKPNDNFCFMLHRFYFITY